MWNDKKDCIKVHGIYYALFLEHSLMIEADETLMTVLVLSLFFPLNLKKERKKERKMSAFNKGREPVPSWSIFFKIYFFSRSGIIYS